MIHTAERVLLRSLESTMSEGTLEGREQEIAAAKGQPKKVLLGAAHTVVGRYPKQVAKLLGVDYDPADLQKPGNLEYVGEGFEAVVFRRGDGVLKVHKGTAFISEAQRQEKAERKAREHAAMAEYLGPFAVPQQVYVDSHPLISRLRAVITEQAFLDGIADTRLVGETAEEGTVAANLERLYAEHPEAVSQLPGFISSSYDLDDSHNLLPDTNGPSNLMVEPEGGLVMVDGQPIGQEHAGVQDVIRRQLESLAIAHEAVA
ncbi:MAG TPA: hypothetical protein VFX79_03250 [Candidatus Saccharimonadales bacterium]|nr:hypothetical protein [Candidatus Saccharimonadales bacterium]